MKRVLPDTNFYTQMLRNSDKAGEVVALASKLSFRFYGFDEVRYELKAAPRIAAPFLDRNLRADLLRLYESLITKEYLFEQRMMDLAVEYYNRYRSLGGTAPHTDIITDFLIVACASLNGVDVLVSDDASTMLNRRAVQSYMDVNGKHSLGLPKLWSYAGFISELSRLNRIRPEGGSGQ